MSSRYVESDLDWEKQTCRCGAEAESAERKNRRTVPLEACPKAPSCGQPSPTIPLCRLLHEVSGLKAVKTRTLVVKTGPHRSPPNHLQTRPPNVHVVDGDEARKLFLWRLHGICEIGWVQKVMMTNRRVSLFFAVPDGQMMNASALSASATAQCLLRLAQCPAQVSPAQESTCQTDAQRTLRGVVQTYVPTPVMHDSFRSPKRYALRAA